MLSDQWPGTPHGMGCEAPAEAFSWPAPQQASELPRLSFVVLIARLGCGLRLPEWLALTSSITVARLIAYDL